LAYSNLVINGGTSTIFNLPANATTINTLAIATGVFNLGGFNLTAAALSNTGTLRLRGDEVVTITANNDVDSGAWEYVGNGDGSTDNYTIKDFGASDYYSLILTSTNTADNFRLNGALTLGGALTISSSTLNTQVATNTITIAGNWTKTTNATFLNNNSTVTFNGTAQTLSGNTTFYGMKAITAGSTLYFTAGTTQYVTGKVEWRNINVRSTVDNSAWGFKYSGSSQSLSGLTVQDSNASLGTVMDASVPPLSTNLGNNTNWNFGTPVNFTWLGTLSTSWKQNGNWQGGAYPGATDVARFDVN
jgi:hypothetical protein